MTDIVKWLREQAANDFTCEAKLIEAADLIEKLVGENQSVKAMTWAQAGEIDKVAAENYRLTKKVEALQNRLYLNKIPHDLTDRTHD